MEPYFLNTNNNTTQFRVPNLKPYLNYSFDVLATNSEFNGTFTGNSVTISTLIAGLYMKFIIYLYIFMLGFITPFIKVRLHYDWAKCENLSDFFQFDKTASMLIWALSLKPY